MGRTDPDGSGQVERAGEDMTGFVTRRKLAAAAGATAIGVSGMIAYAAWTSSGSGGGTVIAGNATAILVADATNSTTLYPDGKGDLVVKLTNNNPYAVEVTSIAQGALSSGSATAAAVSDNHANCTASTVTFTPPTLSGVVVAGNGGQYTVTLHNALSMSNDAENACQSATFTVPVIANAASTASTPAATSGSFGS
jgi:hypothetical protein